MTRLKKILFEGRTEPISKQKAVNIFHDQIGLRPSRLPGIYRGLNSDFKYGFIEPANFTRESANTSNHYTLLIDNSENWSEYPKRSESVVCTTSRERAIMYGDPYLIFPLPGAEIGVCSDVDIWDSFPYLQRKIGFDNLDSLNNTFMYLAELCFEKGNLSENWPELRDELEKIPDCERFNEIYQTGEVRKNFPQYVKSRLIELARTYYPNYTNFYEMIKDLLDPQKNNFELEELKAGLTLPSNREVWTDSPCLLVAESYFSGFL